MPLTLNQLYAARVIHAIEELLIVNEYNRVNPKDAEEMMMYVRSHVWEKGTLQIVIDTIYDIVSPER